MRKLFVSAGLVFFSAAGSVAIGVAWFSTYRLLIAGINDPESVALPLGLLSLVMSLLATAGGCFAIGVSRG